MPFIATCVDAIGTVFWDRPQPIEHLVGEQIAQLLFIKVATPSLIQVTSLARTEQGEYGLGAHTN